MRCLEIINKLSYKKCLEYYNQNIDRIKTNRKIIVDLYKEKNLVKNLVNSKIFRIFTM